MVEHAYGLHISVLPRAKSFKQSPGGSYRSELYQKTLVSRNRKNGLLDRGGWLSTLWASKSLC